MDVYTWETNYFKIYYLLLIFIICVLDESELAPQLIGWTDRYLDFYHYASNLVRVGFRNTEMITIWIFTITNLTWCVLSSAILRWSQWRWSPYGYLSLLILLGACCLQQYWDGHNGDDHHMDIYHYQSNLVRVVFSNIEMITIDMITIWIFIITNLTWCV